MSPSDPALRISIHCERTLIVTFSRGGTKPLPVHTNITAQNLAEFLEEVSNGLNTLRRWSVGNNVRLDLRRACDVLREVIKIQAGNISVLFQRADRDRVREFLLGTLTAWRNSGKETYLAPVIQITGSIDHMLPLEFLPLIDATPPDPNKNTFIDLLDMAARFPAFSGIVHRTLLEKVGPLSVELDNTEKLRIRLFQHADTATARAGLAFLNTSDGIKVIGPWPSEPLERRQFILDFATQLWHGGTPAMPGAPAVSDHIQYFACHCDTQQSKTLDYSLLLASDRKWWPTQRETNVTLRDLHQAFVGFQPPRSTGGPLPLVFLNACGGSRMKPTGVASFPRFFLDNENCCVIATETPVQDDFAELFAREFYTQLLRIKNCGEALFRARWRLLEDKHNPQGILYSMYGGLDLRVRQARLAL